MGNKKQRSRGCLVKMIVFLSVLLILLLVLCYREASRNITQPIETLPATQYPEVIPEEPDVTEAVVTVPVVTEPVETEPIQTQPEETQPLPAPLVVIDAGHQAKGNRDREPIGPGATQMKAKVTSGTQGVITGLQEYELNLLVAQALQKILENRGYRVEMIRDDHDVDLSNAQRAVMANELEADVFIRIHANSVEDASVHGIMTLCQTPENPYNGHLYSLSRKLSQLVLDETAAATGGKKQHVWETDTMTGINWCQVPVTIVEMGYMSNPEEDQLMATEDYRQKLAEGIANGIDGYFNTGTQ